MRTTVPDGDGALGAPVGDSPAEGLSAEAILAEYPHLISRGCRGLAYYLANKAAFDAELDAERGEHNGPGFRGSEA